MAKRLGKEARRRERRTEKEPPSSSFSSEILVPWMEVEVVEDVEEEEGSILSGEEESFGSSGLGEAEPGACAGADLAGAGLWE